ncbi:VOC family protein [Chondrinema litorale]|uniref:VOC family protein n=1 Tax=Chondrinema litorale TaxID=2994555 RepID=UPI002543C0BA|nr:VOC family protein [Chondrinema litorale]UZR98605.1 VOC family protein [Chondrinema litorale]
MENKKGKVTGVGGIFFKCKDPEKLKIWYRDNLGFEVDKYGVLFESSKDEAPGKKAYLQWSLFSEDSKYLAPSPKDFMVNYRVVNLEALAEQLKADGVNILDEIETYEYGKFLHIMDPENNKIELWEPVDSSFDD